ncbi:retrotransposon protein, putative, ty1-copia subclass [Tanacetum coccineum]
MTFHGEVVSKVNRDDSGPGVGKTKDGVNVRNDMEDMGIQPKLAYKVISGKRRYVRNRSRPEGSIFKGHAAEEVTEFGTKYLKDVRNIDIPESWHNGRLGRVVTNLPSILVDGPPQSSSLGAPKPETLRFQHNLGEVHWTAIKNILKYLRNIKDMVLVYRGIPKIELKVTFYADADFQTDKDDTKSQLGYVFVLNGGAVDWKSAKQGTSDMSSTELSTLLQLRH